MTLSGYLSVACLVVAGVAGLDNGVGRRPPMGWLSWERFRCNTNCYTDPQNCISERLYMDMADAIYHGDLKYSGYEYINIDDCWMAKERDDQGNIQADHDRFPSGIRFLADYMHGRELKLGVYTDIGAKTCAGYPGSGGHFEQDAKTFAAWGVDMVKVDGCSEDVSSMPIAYQQFGQALNKTGRPMLYSCSWPAYEVRAGLTPNYTQIAETCNIWRNYKDIQDSWDSVKEIIQFYGNNSGGFLDVVAPGQFNDPDMLIVGDYGLSFEQQKAQMAMWGILGAPLLMSSDLRHLSKQSLSILTDYGPVRANQDYLGLPGKKLMTIGDVEVWGKHMMPEGKSLSYAFLNKNEGGGPIQLHMPLSKLGLHIAEGYNVTQHFVPPYGSKFLGTLKPTDVLNITINPSGVYFGHADFDC